MDRKANLMMKAMSVLLNILALLVGGIASSHDKMNLETHQLLIQKLERVLENLETEDLSKTTLALRLADLYAEKARLLELEDGAQGTLKQKSLTDQSRREAIRLYESYVQKASQQKQGEVYLQTGHLHELLGNDSKAASIYDSLVKNKKQHSKETTARAQTARAELHFRKAQFKDASRLFQAAFANPRAPRRGYLLFRLAWCDYHMGQVLDAKRALTRLLRSPDLMAKKTGGPVDGALQEEASRDLATFISRLGLQKDDLALLNELSPDHAKTSNLTYLATELDRTGRKKDALAVWNSLGQKNQRGTEKLEGQIRIAQIQYDLGRKNETVAEIAKALVLWKEEQCEESADCDVLRQQLRKVITDWGKAEEREPSSQLVQAFTLYIETFPDLEMNYWAGNAARKLKQYSEAGRFFHQAAEIAALGLKTMSRAASPGRISQIFEGALLSEIEVAELSGNLDLKDKAYAHYIKLNPTGARAQHVRYQMAQALSDRKSYLEAAIAFREIALADTGGPATGDLREKAADLALDNLVLAKEDEKLESWALEFSSTFKNRRDDFLRIARKSALNQAAQAFNDPESHGQLRRHLDKLGGIDLSKVDTGDRVTVLKHILLLARELKDLSHLDRASEGLLRISAISEKERNEALANRAWVAELRLEFGKALSYHQKIRSPKLSLDDRTMKLAILAELSGKDPTEYYETYIKHGRLQSQRQWSAFQLILRAKNKAKAFQKFAPALAANTALFRKAALVTYQQTGNLALIRPVPNDNSPEGRFFSQLTFLNSFEPLEKSISRLRLNGASQRALRASLEQRLRMIAKLESATNKAIDMGLWTIQLRALSTTAQAYQNLAKEIQGLPVPAGLRAAERNQYRQLLAEKAQPYTQKLKEIRGQIDKLWDADENLKDLLTQAQAPAPELAKAARWELKIVTGIAKMTGHLAVVSKMKPRSGRTVGESRVAEARDQVRRNPFSVQSIEALRDLERLQGRESMVAYLDARILELRERSRN